jgi:hypothetical protein
VPSSGFPFLIQVSLRALGGCARISAGPPGGRWFSPPVLSPPVLSLDAPAAEVGSLVGWRSIGWRGLVGVRHVGDTLLAVAVPEVVSLESLSEGVAVLSAGNVLRGGRRRDERERN